MSSIELEFESTTNTSNVAKPNKISLNGKILIGLSGGIAVGLTLICAPFVTPAFRKYCLPYVPATSTQVENVLHLLKRAKHNEKLLDIGSGDGRIVIAAAKKGLESHGVELNTWLVQYSRLASLYHNVYGQTRFFRRDLWKFDVSTYRYIVIFGVEQMMNDLENKLQTEAMAGTQIVACRFPLPNMKPKQIIGAGIDSVWLYEIHRKKS